MIKLRVLHVASEAVPLIKTGGLADVAGALPVAQRALGTDARLLLPGYRSVIEKLTAVGAIKSGTVNVGAAFGAARVQLLRARMPGSDLPLIILDAPWFFGREGNPYVNQEGVPWPDNNQRFGLFGWIAAQIAGGQLLPDWQPDVVHCHDWHSGLTPAYLERQSVAKVRRIFTIHNLAYQGRFALHSAAKLMLPEDWMTHDKLEFHGDLSFIKAGIVTADQVTTVSPTYAKEILQPAFGEGLDGLLRQRRSNLHGILNGIDTEIWNPATDLELPQSYDSQNIAAKQHSKRALQRELGLQESANNGPTIATISRLSEQKGLDLVLRAAPEFLALGCQLVVLGSGDERLESQFRQLADQYPGQVSVTIGFDEAMAHRIFGGADAIVIPSRYEPCGLTQLYGLRYGTLPIVTPVGGLADTVVDDLNSDIADKSNGFVIAGSESLADTVRRASAVFSDQQHWRQLMLAAMTTDHSWRGPAQAYLDCYDG